MFVAVELPEEVRGRVADAAAALLAGVRAAKPVARENLHVTVRFVGEVADAAIGELQEAVRGAAASVGSSVAQARGLGAFPDARRPRVVWAGLDDPSRTLTKVEESISSRLAGLGYVREERPFSAHVTLARMRDGVRDFGPLPDRLRAARESPPSFGEVALTAVTVFRSELGRNGSRYSALARFPLDHSG